MSWNISNAITLTSNETGDDDTLRLNIAVDTVSSTTAFSTILVSNRLRVLNFETTITGTGTMAMTVDIGDTRLVAANGAIGTETAALFAYTGTGAGTMGVRGVIAALNNASDLADTTFVVFGNAGGNLTAWIVTADTGATGSITAGEVSGVVIGALGGTGVISETDLILI